MKLRVDQGIRLSSAKKFELLKVDFMIKYLKKRNMYQLFIKEKSHINVEFVKKYFKKSIATVHNLKNSALRSIQIPCTKTTYG